MNDLTPFTYDGHQVRTINEDGEPWFVASDVAKILGYAVAKDMTRRLDDEDKGGRSVPTPGGDQQMTVVSEPGLYVAILGSQVPGARDFKRWVTRDVLPSIRKTGSYGVTAELTGPELMAKALVEAQSTLDAANRELEQARPKAESFDAFLSSNGDYSVNEAAKVLARRHGIKIGAGRLGALLAEWGWTFRRDGRPAVKQTQVETGRLAERAQMSTDWRTGQRVARAPQVRITPKGIDAIARRLIEASTPALA